MNNPCLLSEDERKQAEEAKERTQRVLSDALKKKENLLVEDLKVFLVLLENLYYPLITTDLVEELIQELEKVTFAKNKDPEKDIRANAYVLLCSEDRTIYLCAPFFKKDPESKSQEATIIHEVSHLLGYGHTVQENSDRVQKSPQSMLCPQTAYSVASALTSSMDHPETFTDGSYSCCGETSRDTVCQKSWVSNQIRSMHIMNSRRQMLLRRYTASEETDTISDDTDLSDEDTETSEDKDSTTEPTSTDTGLDHRWISQVKRKIDLIKTLNNLLYKQKNLIKNQNNLMKANGYVVEKKADMVKLLASMVKTKADMAATMADIVKLLASMVATKDNMAATKAAKVKTLASEVETKVDRVKRTVDIVKEMVNIMKRKADGVEIQIDLLESLASVLGALVNILKTLPKMLKILARYLRR
ncbi:uncharacterized protein [Phyllobates terribilis]|uniref:uncharacterized protein isoform X2 n=1 Tax=Phyllobates terribilis TaxID=111132 RepID=UPI003CCA821D